MAKPQHKKQKAHWAKVAHIHFQSAVQVAAPWGVLADKAQLPRWQYMRGQLELADATYRGSRMLASSFLSWLQAQVEMGTMSLVAVLTSCAYDATPLSLSMTDAPRKSDHQGPQVKSVHNVLQTEVKVGFVVRMNARLHSGQAAQLARFSLATLAEGSPSARVPGSTSPAEGAPSPAARCQGPVEAGQDIRCLFFELPCLLHSCDRGTGEVLKAALESATLLELLEDLRARCMVDISIGVADRASSNLRAERALRIVGASARRLRAARITLSCDVHAWHRSCGRALNTIGDLSGIVNLALATRIAPTSLQEIRDLAVHKILATLRVHTGAPPLLDSDEAVLHRRRLFRLCLPPSPQNKKRFEILDYFLNGDIRLPYVEFYGNVDKQLLAQEVARALFVRVPLLQRHRWCGAFAPVLQLALCFNTCGLGQFVYAEWLQPPTAHRKPAEGAPSADAKGSNLNTEDYHKMNSRVRGTAKEWLASMPRGRLLVAAIGQSPIVAGLWRTLHICSTEWEEAQRAAAAAATGAPRHFRLAEAHKGTLTEPFFQSVRALLLGKPDPTTGEDVWSLLPAGMRSRAAASTAFASLACGAGSVFLKIAKEHSGYPYKLFSLLEDLAGAAQILADGHDMHDDFTSDFLRIFPTKKTLTSPQAICTLLLVDMLSSLSTQQIECRHAWIRRTAYLLSQTHAPAFHNLSAQWLFQSARRIEQAGMPSGGHSGPPLPLHWRRLRERPRPLLTAQGRPLSARSRCSFSQESLWARRPGLPLAAVPRSQAPTSVPQLCFWLRERHPPHNHQAMRHKPSPWLRERPRPHRGPAAGGLTGCGCTDA